MRTKAVTPGSDLNLTEGREGVPLFIDKVTGRLLVNVSGITLEAGDINIDTDALEEGIGAPDDAAAAADDSTASLIALVKRLFGKFTPLATNAKQDTGNTSLASIDTKTPALSSGRVPVDGSGVTQPVSAAALPLPSGAATSAAQTTGNSSLSSIDGKLPALATGRVPVDGSGVTQPVSAASLPLPSGAATSAKQDTAQASFTSIDGKVGLAPSADTATHGINRTRSMTLGNTAVAVKAGAGNLLGLTVINPNDVPVYLKFYDTAQGNVTVGTTTVVDTLAVPAAVDGDPGVLMIAPGAFPCLPRFGTAITVAAVTGLADNSSADPTTDLVAQFYHA